MLAAVPPVPAEAMPEMQHRGIPDPPSSWQGGQCTPVPSALPVPHCQPAAQALVLPQQPVLPPFVCSSGAGQRWQRVGGERPPASPGALKI